MVDVNKLWICFLVNSVAARVASQKMKLLCNGKAEKIFV